MQVQVEKGKLYRLNDKYIDAVVEVETITEYGTAKIRFHRVDRPIEGESQFVTIDDLDSLDDIAEDIFRNVLDEADSLLVELVGEDKAESDYFDWPDCNQGQACYDIILESLQAGDDEEQAFDAGLNYLKGWLEYID